MFQQLTSSSRGVGLRAPHVAELCSGTRREDIDFLELAPENWMDAGGRRRERLDAIASRYPLVAHGLSLSVAGVCPLDYGFLDSVKNFLDDYGIAVYSEHLCLTRDSQGYLYDLIPVPRHERNLDYFADRVRRVQDRLQRVLVLENITSYHSWAGEMQEGEFFARLVEKSGCELLLDANNLYVNSKNRGLDPMEHVRSLPGRSIRYMHVAGHYLSEEGLYMDSHGCEVPEAVLSLARAVFDHHGPRPVLLERDNNIPSLNTLCAELKYIHDSVHARAETLCPAACSPKRACTSN